MKSKSLSVALVAVLGLLGSYAWASGHDDHAAPSGDKGTETANFIFHHVSDDEEFEYEFIEL